MDLSSKGAGVVWACVCLCVYACVQQGEWLELRTRTWIWTSGYHPNWEALGAHEWHSFAGRVLPKGARQTE